MFSDRIQQSSALTKWAVRIAKASIECKDQRCCNQAAREAQLWVPILYIHTKSGMFSDVFAGNVALSLSLWWALSNTPRGLLNELFVLNVNTTRINGQSDRQP
jgi:hypothetical protein